MIKLGLLACVKKKRTGLHPARDLYISTLFSYAKLYMDEEMDDWYILSAKYGFVHNRTQIQEYDLTLNAMPTVERRSWAHIVWRDLQKVCVDTHLTFISGNRYREFLIPFLIDAQIPYVVPLLGLGIGKQVAWLKNKTGGVSDV